MVNLKINGQEVCVPEGTTIMNAAGKVGIDIPHLCYLEGINEIGACRICIVEIAGYEKMVTACNTMCKEGMEVMTNSPKVRRARKINLELIFSEHNTHCATCIGNGNCTLQSVAHQLSLFNQEYEDVSDAPRWNFDYPLIRDNSKCIKCMRCIQVCDNIQQLNVWDLRASGYRTAVGVRDNTEFNKVGCSLCGQCITHCPVGALSERDDRGKLNDALENPDIVTMVQVAPAVRTAWGKGIGLDDDEATMGKLICALKKIGIDYVFDTNYAADLTIMEEGSEFLERLNNKDENKWPMFTSCCPGWVRFVKTQYPEFVPNLSTAKSPQQMFGAMAKTYIAKKHGIDPDKVFSISIMPCTAKKYERSVAEVNSAGHGSDVDLVLTTRELDRFIRSDSINPDELKEMPYDGIFDEGSGAAVIFGTTGGVMEAALRSAYFLVTGENPQPDAFSDVRGMDGWKEATFNMAGIELKVAVASGLGNTRRLMEAIKRGEVEYDFVEIMACPGGCVGGGGQPYRDGFEFAAERGQRLYGLDEHCDIRFSHENPAVKLTYEEFLEKPLSHAAHELLHTDLTEWNLDM